jgi:hypothetical protein
MMNKMFKINGNPDQYEDLDVFHKLAQQFLPYAQQSLGFDKPVGVNLLSDPENLKDPLGKTAYYDPNKMEITLFVDKRHVKDILRSMAHELVHHTQNCRGEFDGGVKTGPGYAQDDEHMRKMEAEAYLKGSGFLLRDWEDSLKENKTMSKLNEKKRGDENWRPATLRQVLEFYNKTASSDESFRQMVMNFLETAIDGADPLSEPQQAVADLFSGSEEQLAAVLADDPEEKALASAPPETPLFDDDWEDRDVARGARGAPLEEGEGALCEDCGEVHEGACMEEAKNENWFKGNKDQLLFERLVDKWIK